MVRATPKQKILLLVLAFVFIVGSIVSFYLIRQQTRLTSKAAGVQTNDQLANTELSFITPIYNRYLTNGGNLDGLFANSLNWSTANSQLVGVYRILCTQAAVTAVVKGSSLTSSDPYVQYFSRQYNSAQFRSVADSIFDAHVKQAAGVDCLLAANLFRNVLSTSLRDTILDDIVYLARKVTRDFDAAGGVLPYFQSRAAANYGDSQAEEALSVADFYHLLAKLMPNSGHGSLTPTERTDYYNRAKQLIEWSYSKCATNCSFRGSRWLVNNHQMDPNPNYTLSLLIGYAEVAMVYNQLGLPLPGDIFTSPMRLAVEAIGTSLDQYLTPSFTFKGPFNIVGATGNIKTTYDYSGTKYTIDNSPKYPITSAIPTDKIDGILTQVPPGTNTSKIYVHAGNKLWNYNCDTFCRAIYEISPLSEIWKNIDTTSLAGNGWTTTPPPADQIDALSQWYLPFKSDLKSYIFRNNQVWHYICYAAGNCVAQYYKTLGSFWPTANWVAAGWNTYNPPSDRVDAITAYIIPNTRNARNYVFRGNRVWAYNCADVDTATISCNAFYTKDLTSFWQPIGGNWSAAGWGTTPPPTDYVDSFHQYYLPDNVTLKSYIVRGNTIWAYNCTPAGCNPLYVQNLNDFFKNIKDQYKWPQYPTGGVAQMTGVSDWAHDGTIQNAGYTIMYLLNPFLDQVRYQNLQNEQVRRDRQNSPPYPVNYENNAWNFNNFAGTKYTSPILMLMDGWRPIDTATDEQYDLTAWAPPDLNAKINSHWWDNMLAARNHLTAYLALSSNRLMAPFSEPPVTPGCFPSTTSSWQSTPIPAQSSTFTFEYDLTPTQGNVDTLVGLSNKAPTAFSDLVAIVRTNPSGFFDARNGGAYAGSGQIPYTAGSTYHIRMVVNPAAHTYSVYVTPPGQTERTLAINYAFRSEQANTSTLSYWNQYSASGNQTVCNVSQTTAAPTPTPPPSACISSTPTSFQSASIPAQSSTFTFEYDLTPTQGNVDTLVALSNKAPTAFSDLAAIIRTNPTGFFDARNGGSYAGSGQIPYTAGATYHIRTIINPAAHTYSVYVTPPGQTERTLATNYAFRSEQANTSTISYWTQYSASGNQTVCNVSQTTAAPTPTPQPGACAPSSLAWQSTPITSQSSSFNFEFDLTPNQNRVNNVVGLGGKVATAFTDLPVILRMNEGGVFDARNGGVYAASAQIPYSAGTTYHVRLVTNPTFHNYSVYITPPGQTEKTLASNYTFRTEQYDTPTFSYWNQVATIDSHTVCNISQTASACAPSSSSWQSTPISTQNNIFSFEYDLTPTQNNIDTLVGLSGKPAAAYTDLAAIVRTNPTGFFDVRNGSSYVSSGLIPYTANTTYHIRMIINLTAHTYSAYVTPPGQTEKTLGTNLALRTEQATASTISYWNQISASGNQTVCNVR